VIYTKWAFNFTNNPQALPQPKDAGITKIYIASRHDISKHNIYGWVKKLKKRDRQVSAQS
jgi:transposase-like protein